MIMGNPDLQNRQTPSMKIGDENRSRKFEPRLSPDWAQIGLKLDEFRRIPGKFSKALREVPRPPRLAPTSRSRAPPTSRRAPAGRRARRLSPRHERADRAPPLGLVQRPRCQIGVQLGSQNWVGPQPKSHPNPSQISQRRAARSQSRRVSARTSSRRPPSPRGLAGAPIYITAR